MLYKHIFTLSQTINFCFIIENYEYSLLKPKHINSDFLQIISIDLHKLEHEASTGQIQLNICNFSEFSDLWVIDNTNKIAPKAVKRVLISVVISFQTNVIVKNNDWKQSVSIIVLHFMFNKQ